MIYRHSEETCQYRPTRDRRDRHSSSLKGVVDKPKLLPEVCSPQNPGVTYLQLRSAVREEMSRIQAQEQFHAEEAVPAEDCHDHSDMPQCRRRMERRNLEGHGESNQTQNHSPEGRGTSPLRSPRPGRSPQLGLLCGEVANNRLGRCAQRKHTCCGILALPYGMSGALL
eukprot:372988-Hanusia_phi.AAC.1